MTSPTEWTDFPHRRRNQFVATLCNRPNNIQMWHYLTGRHSAAKLGWWWIGGQSTTAVQAPFSHASCCARVLDVPIIPRRVLSTCRLMFASPQRATLRDTFKHGRVVAVNVLGLVCRGFVEVLQRINPFYTCLWRSHRNGAGHNLCYMRSGALFSNNLRQYIGWQYQLKIRSSFIADALIKRLDAVKLLWRRELTDIVFNVSIYSRDTDLKMSLLINHKLLWDKKKV